MLYPPADWSLLPPGDPALTRRVKAVGPTWTVQQKRGRKVFSLGVRAPTANIEAIRQKLAVEREKPQYTKRRKADAEQRERKQEANVGSFRQAAIDFLAFARYYGELAEKLAAAVPLHVAPVGSGSVART